MPPRSAATVMPDPANRAGPVEVTATPAPARRASTGSSRWSSAGAGAPSHDTMLARPRVTGLRCVYPSMPVRPGAVPVPKAPIAAAVVLGNVEVRGRASGRSERRNGACPARSARLRWPRPSTSTTHTRSARGRSSAPRAVSLTSLVAVVRPTPSAPAAAGRTAARPRVPYSGATRPGGSAGSATGAGASAGASLTGRCAGWSSATAPARSPPRPGRRRGPPPRRSRGRRRRRA